MNGPRICESPRKVYLEFLLTSLENIKRDITSRNPNTDFILSRLHQVCVYANQGNWLGYLDEETSDLLYNSFETLNGSQVMVDNRPKLRTVSTGICGRPSYVIDEKELRKYAEMGFTLTEISKILGVCRKTITRRFNQFKLRVDFPTDSGLSEDDLDSVVKDILMEFPNSGIRNTKGHLLAKGIRATWDEVRSSLWRVDPEGILNRAILRKVKIDIDSLASESKVCDFYCSD